MVFPPIWGKKWRRSEHAHASYPGLFFRPPGFSPYMGREERRVQELDYPHTGLKNHVLKQLQRARQRTVLLRKKMEEKIPVKDLTRSKSDTSLE